MSRAVLTLRRWVRSPLFWILCIAALLRITGLLWGLPASDGWDDDGVAPRNFLVGLVQTYTPGAHFTYPPFHMFILALLSLPGIVMALFAAPSLHPQEVIGTITHIPYMTYFAIVARLVSIAFSLGTIVVIARMAELMAGRRAGLLAAAALALNAALVYYGVATNLDGPSLFWAALSFYLFMRLMACHDVRSIRWGALSAAAAMATKDQTYALFLLAFPLGLGFWFFADRWARDNAALLVRSLALWGAVAILALLLIDGAITNPHGFADRIAFLTGSASKDYAEYEASPTGWGRLLLDAFSNGDRYYPGLFALLAGVGIIRVITRFRPPSGAFAAGLLPLFATISFTVAFNLVALRTESRFLLPQSVFLAVYIGIGLDLFLAFPKSIARTAFLALSLAAACLGFVRCAGIATAFLADPRYDAEKWMTAHMSAGDKVEIYGLNAYLPRFPVGPELVRVGPKPLKARNPVPGITEIREPYGTVWQRQPRFLVVPGFWVGDYLSHQEILPEKGRIVPKVSRTAQLDVDARNYFGALFAGRLPYRLAHVSAYKAPLGPSANAYESLAQSVFIFERDPARSFEPIVTAPKSAARMPLYGESWRTAERALCSGREPGLAFVSLGYHIEQTWGWDA